MKIVSKIKLLKKKIKNEKGVKNGKVGIKQRRN